MTGLLRSIWDEPRPPRPPVRVWRDWALVGVLVPAAVIEGLLNPDGEWRTFSVLVVIALVPTLLWRRTRPLLMVGIAFGTCGVAEVVVGGDLGVNTLAFVLLLAYALFRWGSGRAAVLGAAVISAKIGSSAVLGHLTLGDLIGAFVVVALVSALGTALRFRANARMRELDQVKLLERERLARDLHDTVAHHVSAMAIRAQAGLATLETQPAAAADALRLIESEASRTLAEMRTMVRALRRNEPAELVPSPGIGELAQLAGRLRGGPTVDVEVVGELDDLPPSVGTAIYRLAQESVTNARRHARHATHIMVRVVADDTSVRVRITDDGDTTSQRQPAPPGYGLIGMIERVDLLGGTCQAGPDAGRGWTVDAVLPRAVASA